MDGMGIVFLWMLCYNWEENNLIKSFYPYERTVSMKKTILFDLDGTLTDSGEGIMKCAQLALSTYNIPIPDDKTMRTVVGPPLEVSFARFGMRDEDISDAIEVFRKRYTAVGKYENFPYPGIHELLQALLDQGYTLAVATSKPEVMALDILHHFDLARFFGKNICGATLDRSRITKEDVITFLLNSMGNPKDLIMVGDTQYDVIGAKAHGIPTIGVTWGYGEEEAIRSAGAAAIAQTMDELLNLINTLPV